jgi:hypothetical protein
MRLKRVQPPHLSVSPAICRKPALEYLFRQFHEQPFATAPAPIALDAADESLAVMVDLHERTATAQTAGASVMIKAQKRQGGFTPMA